MHDGSVKRYAVYNQYSLGLAFVSGPFVLIGHALDKITNGLIGARSFAVLIIPVMSALSALLIYEIGLLLGASARASVWGAIVFAAGTPQLTFARLFYTEVAVIFFCDAVDLGLFCVRSRLQTETLVDKPPVAHCSGRCWPARDWPARALATTRKRPSSWRSARE